MSNRNRDDAVDELGATAQSDRAALDATAPSDTGVAESPPASSHPARVLATGTHVDRYEIVSFLGAGAMGSVYRARDSELAREVALKVLDTTGLGIDAARMRLRREAQAMARVDHPAVVRIFDVGTTDAHLYVTMQLVPGGTLSSWLKGRPRTWREILAAYVTAGRGLAAAHAAGIVHRDFKPANVLVDDAGVVRVTDFGLAHGDDEVSTKHVNKQRSALHVELTATGELVGTPLYMAPEQMRGDQTDARADQFAFCVALWEALYSKLPFAFTGTGFAALDSLRASIEAGSIVSPPRDANVPRKIEQALCRGLSADPGLRWPDMTVLVDAIEQKPRSPRALVTVSAALLLAAGTIVVWQGARTSHPVRTPFVLGTPELIDETMPQVDRKAQTLRIDLRPNREIVRAKRDELTVESITRRQARNPFGSSTWIRIGIHSRRWKAIASTTSKNGTRCTLWQVPIDGGPSVSLVPEYVCGWIDITKDHSHFAFLDGDHVVIRDLVRNVDIKFNAEEPDPLVGAFSPDGSKLCVITSKSVQITAIDGVRITRIPASVKKASWLDERHLVLAVQGVEDNSELRMVSIDHPTDITLLREVPGRVTGLNTSTDGLLVETNERAGRIYTIPTSGLDEDAALSKPLDTGSIKDGGPVAWSDAGLFVASLVHRHQAILRIKNGIVTPVVTADLGQRIITAMDPSVGSILYAVDDATHCTNRLLDLASGTTAAARLGICETGIGFIICARNAPRCMIAMDKLRSLDPRNQTVGEATNDDIAALSPDGTKSLRIDGADPNHWIVERDGHVEAEFHIDPPIAEGVGYVLWAPVGDRWWVTSADGSKGLMFELDTTGHRHTIAWTNGHLFQKPTISPDGTQIAVAITSASTRWSFIPIQHN